MTIYFNNIYSDYDDYDQQTFLTILTQTFILILIFEGYIVYYSHNINYIYNIYCSIIHLNYKNQKRSKKSQSNSRIKSFFDTNFSKSFSIYIIMLLLYLNIQAINAINSSTSKFANPTSNIKTNNYQLTNTILWSSGTTFYLFTNISSILNILYIVNINVYE